MPLEVYYLMAHLIITLAIIGGYIYTVIIGHPDATLQNMVFVVGGYWFGLIGQSVLPKKSTNNPTKAANPPNTQPPNQGQNGGNV